MTNEITARIEKMDNQALCDSINQLKNDLQDGANLVFNAVLNELEKRLPEADFVKLCEAL